VTYVKFVVGEMGLEYIFSQISPPFSCQSAFNHRSYHNAIALTTQQAVMCSRPLSYELHLWLRTKLLMSGQPKGNVISGVKVETV
jgi:hypothetical protein